MQFKNDSRLDRSEEKETEKQELYRELLPLLALLTSDTNFRRKRISHANSYVCFRLN